MVSIGGDSIDRLAQRIAQLHKDNRNPPSTSPRIGIVVSGDPIKIQWGDHIVITEDKLFIPKVFSQGYTIPYRWQDTEGNMVDDETIFQITLEPQDKVLIMPDEYLKMWFLIEKLG